MDNALHSVLEGTWTYRSFNNDQNLRKDVGDLLFGAGYIRIDPSAPNELKGLIYGQNNLSQASPDLPPDWSLDLKGSINYGNPYTIRMQGKGVNNGEEWIYNYVGYLVLPWVDGVDQQPAIVGSIVRVIPHHGSSGKAIHPAGVVASWYAVKNEPWT